jgi:hypothetical protein
MDPLPELELSASEREERPEGKLKALHLAGKSKEQHAKPSLASATYPHHAATSKCFPTVWERAANLKPALQIR